MVTAGIILLIIGSLIGLFFAARAVKNMGGILSGDIPVQEGIANHLKKVIPIAFGGVLIFVGLVLTLVGVFSS